MKQFPLATLIVALFLALAISHVCSQNPSLNDLVSNMGTYVQQLVNNPGDGNAATNWINTLSQITRALQLGTRQQSVAAASREPTTFFSAISCGSISPILEWTWCKMKAVSRFRMLANETDFAVGSAGHERGLSRDLAHILGRIQCGHRFGHKTKNHSTRNTGCSLFRRLEIRTTSQLLQHFNLYERLTEINHCKAYSWKIVKKISCDNL